LELAYTQGQFEGRELARQCKVKSSSFHHSNQLSFKHAAGSGRRRFGAHLSDPPPPGWLFGSGGGNRRSGRRVDGAAGDGRGVLAPRSAVMTPTPPGCVARVRCPNRPTRAG